MAMTKITAVVRADKSKDVVAALRKAGAPGFTYFDVKGHGREIDVKTQIMAVGSTEEVITSDIIADVLPRVKFEIICKESDCSRTVSALKGASTTGVKGDGIIFTEQIGDVVRISTGEKGESAL